VNPNPIVNIVAPKSRSKLFIRGVFVMCFVNLNIIDIIIAEQQIRLKNKGILFFNSLFGVDEVLK